MCVPCLLDTCTNQAEYKLHKLNETRGGEKSTNFWGKTSKVKARKVSREAPKYEKVKRDTFSFHIHTHTHAFHSFKHTVASHLVFVFFSPSSITVCLYTFFALFSPSPSLVFSIFVSLCERFIFSLF